MTGFLLALDAFHFMRPLLLLMLLVPIVLWWRYRRHIAQEAKHADGLAPHLRDAMTLGATKKAWLRPVDGACGVIALCILGAAGPTWSRIPDPFMAQTAPVVIVLEVSKSMTAQDIQPSRLERAKQKIRDLMARRGGARTALVAYSATAHRVVPLTEDVQIMQLYLEGLLPEVMPDDGANIIAAREIAEEILAAEAAPGGILYVLDGIDSADVTAMNAPSPNSAVFLSMLPESESDAGLGTVSQARVVTVTPDEGDIRTLDRELNTAYQRALIEDDTLQWADRGWWLAVPAAALALLWFRRGWTLQWVIVCALLLGGFTPSGARADGLADLFFTPDQQGRMAYERKDYAQAAALFEDPLWQGYALFRNGDYEKAAEVLGRLGTPQAEFIMGIAHLRSRKYRDGVRAFESVLESDPTYPNAQENLDVARRIVVYIEEAQAQSDTGEEGGIGADEVVFDNESGQGAETEIEAPTDTGPELLSTDQWMNSVDTRTSDFLRLRFLLEANKSE